MSEIVTDCVPVYVPAAGAKVGVAVVPPACWMVYVAEPTALLVNPLATAMALSVSLLLTAIGPVYVVDPVVGVVPLVV